MPLYINTNTLSLNAQTHLSQNTMNLQASMEKLSSGFRINRAGDDAAGLELSENLRSQYRGAAQANANVQDGINMLNIADGAMQTIEDNLQRMRELAVEAANDTYSANQRTAISQEITARAADITRIASATQYNGKALLDGTFGAANIQVGPNGVAANDALNVGGAVADVRWATIGGAINVTSNANAETFIGTVDTAINTLNTQRGTLGSFVNQLQSAQSNLSQSTENLQAAEARIRDVDVAAESANLTKNQVLQQSAALVLTQANATPNIALQLLKG